MDPNKEHSAYKRVEQSFNEIIKQIADRHGHELTLAIHGAFDFSEIETPEKVIEAYLRNTTQFLRYCKEHRIPILHFRDSLKMVSDKQEETLEQKFGVPADYEIPTVLNMALPLHLDSSYVESIINYNVFIPRFYVNGNIIKDINTIGGFTDYEGTFHVGVEIAEILASREVRIIQNCTISTKNQPLDLNNLICKYGLSENKVFFYSFEKGKLLKTS